MNMHIDTIGSGQTWTSSLAVSTASSQFGLFFAFAFAPSELLPPPIDAGQFGLDRVVRFAELLNLLLQDGYSLGAVKRGICKKREMPVKNPDPSRSC